MKIIVEIDNIDYAQKEALESLFFQMQNLGNLGGSRWVCFYADGDGNFHPKITIEGKEVRHTNKLSIDALWKTSDYKIDYDWLYT